MSELPTPTCTTWVLTFPSTAPVGAAACVAANDGAVEPVVSETAPDNTVAAAVAVVTVFSSPCVVAAPNPMRAAAIIDLEKRMFTGV